MVVWPRALRDRIVPRKVVLPMGPRATDTAAALLLSRTPDTAGHNENTLQNQPTVKNTPSLSFPKRTQSKIWEKNKNSTELAVEIVNPACSNGDIESGNVLWSGEKARFTVGRRSSPLW